MNELRRSVVQGAPEHVSLAGTVGQRSPQEPSRPGPFSRFIPEAAPSRRLMPNLLGIRRIEPMSWWSVLPWLAVAIIVITGLLVVSSQGVRVRQQVMDDGNRAVDHLAQASAAIQRFDFSGASDGFSGAYEQFGKARDDLGILNGWLGDIVSKLPGGSRVQSAQDLIEAGRLLSEAGGSLTELIAALSESGSILDPANDGRSSFATVLLPMEQSLTEASERMAAAHVLLRGVDRDHIPADQQEAFDDLMAQLPEMEALVHRGADYVKFLERAIAGLGTRTYLLLFQNTTELRPTGGFPGSYGIAVFSDGRLESFEADDVYNPDGQIKDIVVPPLALQHITPNWGLRDSTWFADFELSARKAAELYQAGSGRRVDGVVAITPEIIRGLLEISGPVSMPDYDLVLDADDFLPKLQAQVEYGLDKQENKPKKIIMELAPIVLRKLYQAPRSEWLKVLAVFSAGLRERDIMMYFHEPQLQSFVRAEGFDGRLHEGDEDFLLPLIANVKGAKADAVTDTAMHVETTVAADGVHHRLTLTRRHNGGNTAYGFYNQTNRSYVRVLVPEEAVLDGITGNVRQGFRSLITYGGDAVHDDDLERMEGAARYDALTDVTTYSESGRTSFGFWMTVEPGSTETVTLGWTVPSSYVSDKYALYIQKQPGLDIKEFVWDLSALGTARVRSSVPVLHERGDGWQLRDDYSVDIPLRVTFE